MEQIGIKARLIVWKIHGIKNWRVIFIVQEPIKDIYFIFDAHVCDKQEINLSLNIMLYSKVYNYYVKNIGL